MIDFHSHTFLSDGGLSPAEHIRRAYMSGYKTLGITDHVDFSNIEFVYTSLKKMTDEMNNRYYDMIVIPGIEITHVTPNKIEKIVTIARDYKIPLIIVHGESPVEPVEKGTNRAAIESCVDILAHPGFIGSEDVKKAQQLGVTLEISGRKGHGITNGYVAKLSLDDGCNLVLNSDAHIHTDFLNKEYSDKILRGCGMNEKQIKDLYLSTDNLLQKILLRVF